jgi:hypothetical protein
MAGKLLGHTQVAGRSMRCSASISSCSVTDTRVPEAASLYDAAKSLEKALTGAAADPSRPKDRAVLVQAPDGRARQAVAVGRPARA